LPTSGTPDKRARFARRMRHWRRERLLPRWNAIKPAVIIISVLAVLVLGTIGAEREFPSYSIFDDFYVALSLFALGGFGDPPLPLSLQIARIIAPIITGYAVVQAVTLLFRDNLQLVQVSLFGRDHVVTAGIGSTGSRLVRALDDADFPVVAIERDRTSPGLLLCRDHGISVIKGDARDKLVLRRTQLPRASHLFVACGDDRIDMDVAAAAEQLMASEAGERGALDPLTVFVALDDLRLWRSLSAEILATPRESATRLELFHVYESAARLLVERHPPFRPDDERPHVLVLGMQGIGEALVLHVVRRWHATRARSDFRLALTIVSPDAQRDEAYLLSRYPQLRDVCELSACRNSLEDGDLAEGVEAARLHPGVPRSLYVCLESDSHALAVALGLHKLPTVAGAPIVVAVQDQDAGMANALEQALSEQEQVVAFGVLTAALHKDVLFGGLNELLARAKHAEYLDSEERAGTTPESSPSMVAWDDLPVRLKTENRRFVDGIPAKLALAGCTVVPAPLADPRNGLHRFPSHLVERLAAAEHERWMKSRADDSSHRPSVFVPWEELAGAEKEKDRTPVRQIPAMLARAGFAVVPLEGRR
jgi:voltage-gated potassium channel Kch